LHESGLIPLPLDCTHDSRLPELYGIGFTNIVARTTRGSDDLTQEELKKGALLLEEKLGIATYY